MEGAARCGAATLLVICLCFGAACAPTPGRIHVVTAVGSGPTCAWFADRSNDVIFFGQSSFWSVWRRQPHPEAVVATAEPARIGRFDLATERFLEPLAAGAVIPGGTWDILVGGERIYFTALFAAPGWVNASDGESAELESIGTGSNEIIALPDQRIAFTRYGRGSAEGGSVLLVGRNGALLAEVELGAEKPGWRVAPKSLAFDPGRGWLWINTDLLPDPALDAAGPRHDARALDPTTGELLLRIDAPELQTMTFDAWGRGYWVWSDGVQLMLRVTDRDGERGPHAGRMWLLDDAFAGATDFAQEVRVETDGRVVVTRWSGTIHVLEPSGRLRSLRLPRPDPAGLYYSAFLRGGRVCATFCGGVRVVCASLP